MLTQIIISATIISLASAAFTNLVRDPSFQERFPSRCSKFCTIKGGLSGDQYGNQFRWTSNDNKLEFYRKASDGTTASIDLNTDRTSNVFQLVKGFVPGKTYELSFDVRSNTDCGWTTKTGRAYVNAWDLNAEMSFTAEVDRWVPKTLSFVALATEHRINFKSTELGLCGPLIDNVAVRVINHVRNPTFNSPITTYKQYLQPSYVFPDSSWSTLANSVLELYAPNTVALNHEFPYTVVQLVKGLIPNQKYELSFMISRDPVKWPVQRKCGGKTHYLQVYVDANELRGVSGDYSTMSNFVFERRTLEFTAVATEHQINFKSTTTKESSFGRQRCGPLLRDVVVKEI